ncbi:MAG: 50S ribosomal protein L23, partial [Candidatus Omnitrophica bacterium]|nr:50S ribosomal protein L23 [Candidatus Omnitrophota bacterium]
MPGLKGDYSIIRSPLITEKSSREVIFRKYSFWVDREANKIEIKKAVESVYKVKVSKVATMIVK